MRAVLKYLFLVGIGAGFFVWLAHQPGTLVIELQDYTIGMTLMTLGSIVMLGVVLLLVTQRGWFFIASLPRRIKDSLKERHRRLGYEALSRGMVAVAAGDTREANHQARQMEKHLDDLPLTMLLAAQAAQLRGDTHAATRFFKAMTNRTDMAFLGLRGLTQQALSDGKLQEAEILAERALGIHKESPWAASTLFDIKVRQHAWADAADLAHKATLSNGNAEAVTHRELKKNAALKRAVLLTQQVLDGIDGHFIAITQEHYPLIEDAWAQRVSLTPLTCLYATMLYAQQAPKRAKKVLKQAWKTEPHPDLVITWLNRGTKADTTQTALSRVEEIESLTMGSRDAPESLRWRAHMAIEAELNGMAEKHLMALEKQGVEDKDICNLHARLAEMQGDMAVALRWLERAHESTPDKEWCCTACGHVYDRWHATCHTCHGFNTLAWKVPAHSTASLNRSIPPHPSHGHAHGHETKGSPNKPNKKPPHQRASNDEADMPTPPPPAEG